MKTWPKAPGNGYENSLRIAAGFHTFSGRYSDKNATIRPDLSLYATSIGTEPVVVTTEPVAVAPTESGKPSEVAIVTPGTQLPTPGIVEASAYKKLSRK